jgi:CPA2 family monovalent cation:H+ antiporter-2
LERKLPRKWVKTIERYSANAQSIRAVSNWRIVLRAYLMQVLIHSVIIISIILLSSKFVLPLVEGSRFGHVIAAIVTLVIISPFLYALAMRRVAVKQVSELLEIKKFRGPIIMMIFARVLLTLFFLGFLLNTFFSPIVAFIALVISVMLFVLFPKKLTARYHRIEEHFMKNLNERELSKTKRSRSDLIPWDGHIATFEIAKESNIAGKSLLELKFRENFGVNIAFIKRGEVSINIPERTERIFPGDEIGVIGTDAQFKEFKKFLDQNEKDEKPQIKEPEIVLRQIILKNNVFIGKSIRQSQLREKTNGLVVGIERKGIRTLNPDSNLILNDEDVLWIVGDRKKLEDLTHD